MDTRTSSVFEYVSTSLRTTPSRDTRAMPVPVARPPIQVTEVPVKVNVACAPGVVENAAPPPLHGLLVSWLQPPLGVKVTDGSVSSKRAPDPGGGGGALLDTVTVTEEGVVLPAASRATAVTVCEPSLTVAVFQETEYGALVSSAPKLLPSILNCTPATPTLSEASACTVSVPDTVWPLPGKVMLAVGGVVSAGGGGGALFTVTEIDAELNCRPSKPSRATALKLCEPLAAPVVSQEIEYGAEVAGAPRLAPSSWNCTLETVRPPTMLTLALTGTVPETVDPEAGEDIVTIRLPNWARAWRGIRARKEIANSATAPACRLILSMSCSVIKGRE